MSEASTERKIQDKNLNAPRLTPDDIDAVIMSRKFHHFENTTLTVCCLILQNGTTVVGESACVSMDNFDADIGKSIAYDDARRKVWALEGYLMKERISLTDDGDPFPPINCAQDADVANERSKRGSNVSSDWRKLLDDIWKSRMEQEERIVRKCGKLHISLPPEILDDIKRTMEQTLAQEVILGLAGREYKVIGYDTTSAIVEAV